MNNIITQEKGIVLVFTAMVLPIILIIGTLIIDGGNLYERHGQIEHLSRQSGQSGLLALAQILEDQASTNHQAQCQVETPPSRCDSANLFDFLNQQDLQNIMLSGVNQNQIINNAEYFSTTYDPQKKLTNTEIKTIYPYQYQLGDRDVKISVEITTRPNLLMGKFLSNDRAISYKSVSYLPLQ